MEDNEKDLLPEHSELLSDQLDKGLTLPEAVKNLGPEKIQMYMEGQYLFLVKHYNELQTQLNDLKSKVDTNNTELIRRIERILAQMSNHMNLIRQLLEIVSSYGDRLTEQEQDRLKRDMEYATLVERQNRFAISLARLEKNGKDIVSVLEDVQAKEEKHGALEWKLFTVFSIGFGIVVWLLSGDNFINILIGIRDAFKNM